MAFHCQHTVGRMRAKQVKLLSTPWKQIHDDDDDDDDDDAAAAAAAGAGIQSC